MCALGPGGSPGQRFPVRRLGVTSEDGQPAVLFLRSQAKRLVAIFTSGPTFRLLPLYYYLILLTLMSFDASFTPGDSTMRSPTDQHQGVGSTEAQIERLAGGLGNTNVNGTVGPHFFVARLKNEATIVALYGYLLSDECCLGLQGDVQLPKLTLGSLVDTRWQRMVKPIWCSNLAILLLSNVI